ncbi:NfeD family protein [Alicyclobacillus pomorum]|uniref:NfeD family protein n=1 Tax=Alicyclobacillus pomorum TaxID=204470 RepID=UPI0004262551|nr:NfeD family protein [Alicyclobacillus pomorum]
MRVLVWWTWLIAAFVIGIVEVMTFTFVLLWIAIGAFLTALLTPFIPSAWVQMLIFAVVSVVLLVVTRPLVRKWKQRRIIPSRMESMVGQRGVVIAEAKPGAFATVRVQGDLWSARSEYALRAGQEVAVSEATSTILTVEPIEEVH